MKKLYILTFLLSSILSFSQKEIQSTDHFTVSGKTKNTITFNAVDLAKLESIVIPDVTITNHLGEKKSVAKSLKGILLTTVLSKIELDNDNAKTLSEFYFICIASDGYKVTFSWNELYNNPVGEHTYIVTQKDDKSVTDMKERILLISTTDFKTGRRYVKGLEKIIVARVD